MNFYYYYIKENPLSLPCHFFLLDAFFEKKFLDNDLKIFQDSLVVKKLADPLKEAAGKCLTSNSKKKENVVWSRFVRIEDKSRKDYLEKFGFKVSEIHDNYRVAHLPPSATDPNEITALDALGCNDVSLTMNILRCIKLTDLE